MKTILLWLLSAGAALAQSAEIAVSAGSHDRSNVPVRIDLPDALAGAHAVAVRDVSGRTLPAQITGPGLMSGSGKKELHFVVPSLKAGENAVFTAVAVTAPAATGFRWADTPGRHAELRLGDRPVLRYMYQALDESSKEARDQTYKVFHHLYDPAGTRVLTNGAGGKYPHHRGIFYGFNKVTYGDGKSCDVWHCRGQAHQAHDAFLAADEGPVLGRHRVAVRWHGAEKEVFAREERELTVYATPGGTLVEFASRLKALVPVKLDGDPQHAGFHFRADNEVNDKTSKETYYVRPDGPGRPGETRNWPAQKDHVNLPWNAMSFVLGGKRYTVAYLDRPGNPKEARFSERPYGRFGSYFTHELLTGKTLDIVYRLWLQEGEMKGEEIAAKSAAFVDPPRVGMK